MCAEKKFVKDGKKIVLSGITRNPDFVCYIDIPNLLNGIQVFPCSIKGVDYQLNVNEIKMATAIAKTEN